jgi:(p)ppGpp synthase/HD superfamily hydrolase
VEPGATQGGTAIAAAHRAGTPPLHDKETDDPVLGARFTEAFEYAAELHHLQIRKGSNVPYLAHLMAVAGIVLEHGGDEDVAIAALLHDAVEDQGGLPVLEQIKRRFGLRVATIVRGCSDSVTPKGALKDPWRQRKDAYLAHVVIAGESERLISIADKLHNCRSTVSDLHVEGAAAFDKFNATRDEIVWFYRAFADLARAHDHHDHHERLVRELLQVVDELETLAAGG